MTKIKEKIPFLSEVKGFLAEDEMDTLYEIGLTSAKMGPCLEVGSYCGLSTICIGVGVRESGGILFSIDHHRGSEEHQVGEEYFDPDLYDERLGRINTFNEFEKNIERALLLDYVVPIVAKSHIVARKWATPLSFVFIDGSHSFESAKRDYISWAPHIIPGGFLGIHDVFFDPSQGGDAPRRVYEMAIASGLFEKYKFVNTLGILRRIEI